MGIYLDVLIFYYTSRRRNTRCKNPQLVAQRCFVASFGSMFHIFHLARSTCRTTIKFVSCWRNAVRWLVDLLGVDLIWPHLLRDKLWVWWKTSNKAKICCSKSTSALLFATPFFNPQQMFLLRDKLITQGEILETSTRTCNETMLCDKLRVLYLVFLRLKKTHTCFLLVLCS